MLTYAIGFIQNVQLACFAAVFVLMAAADRTNRSLRWLACAYVAGFSGAVLDWGHHLLPLWFWITFTTLAAPIGYACVHAGIVHFVRWGGRTRWVSAVLIFGTLPFYLFWSFSLSHAHWGAMDRIATLSDFSLAVQTALSAWLLFSTRDEETTWPRRVMGAFLSFYSAVEFSRVAVFLFTGQMPSQVAPWVEIASGIVYVVSCSVLPLAFIWMMNARLHAHMSRQMTTDPLTELLNRRGLQSVCELEVARCLRERRDFAVVLMDIDHFKRLNDTFGHASGDIVLRDTAALFRSLVHESDIIGRLGGEEFALLLPATPAAGAINLVERLRTAVEEHRFHLDGEQIGITASFGVSASAGRGDLTWSLLLNEADQALYAAKRAGRNLSRLYRTDLVAVEGSQLPPRQEEDVLQTV